MEEEGDQRRAQYGDGAQAEPGKDVHPKEPDDELFGQYLALYSRHGQAEVLEQHHERHEWRRHGDQPEIRRAEHMRQHTRGNEARGEDDTLRRQRRRRASDRAILEIVSRVRAPGAALVHPRVSVSMCRNSTPIRLRAERYADW